MKTYMIRPVLYLCAGKWAAAAAFALAWNRFFNIGGQRPLGWAFAACAAVFAGLAWLQYLNLDGMSLQYLFEDKREKKKKHPKRDIADYVDERITALADLEEDERAFCRLASNLVSALFCVVLTLLL